MKKSEIRKKWFEGCVKRLEYKKDEEREHRWSMFVLRASAIIVFLIVLWKII